MAQVHISNPHVTVTVQSEPTEPDEHLTADQLADFALALAEHHMPGTTRIGCVYTSRGDLGGLTAEAQVPAHLFATAADEATEPRCPSCEHPAGVHTSHNARGSNVEPGCREPGCGCMRSKERVWKATETTAA